MLKRRGRQIDSEWERTGSEGRNELGEGNEEEIEIKKDLKLLVKDDGQEGEYIVLLISNNVGSKLALQLVFPNVAMSGV
jgi:hypothetical protein